MSRRKQAKPRAVLKSGGDGEDIQQGASLQYESKDDSAATYSDDDDGLESEDEQTSSHVVVHNAGDMTDVLSAPLNHHDGINNMDHHNSINDIDNIVVDPNSASTSSNHCVRKKDLENDEEMYLQDNMRPSSEIYRIADTNQDDEDNSSDSFYSDLYSTHTSSSYSPSTSEGALTPNSLLHHHQQPHHHSQHLVGLHHPQDNRDINRLRASHEQRRRRHFRGASSTANVSCERRDDDEEAREEDDEEMEHADSHDEDEIGANQALEGADPADNYDDDDTNEPHSGLGGTDGGNVKIPGKLRKIEREALKSEKTTGDGIKGSTDGSYQCQFCDKSFPRLGYLKKHEQSHAEHLPFKCDYCARLFKHKRSRDRHTKLHTGDRRYRCPHCEAAFSRSDHLKIHMKTHDTQKPFQCTVCNRGYNTAAALTSHMQNHKKQAALLGSGQSLYSPRSTGSGSSSGSFHKRRYAMTDCSPSGRPDYRKHGRLGSLMACIYCTKSDFTSLEQLNAHIQSMHEQSASTAKESILAAGPPSTPAVFQLSCEYCTMKFPNIPTMFQHMRTTHIDRLTSPNSYFEHFNRLAASGTFSPRLLTNTAFRGFNNTETEPKIKVEQPSPNHSRHSQGGSEKDEEQTLPTDLSQPGKRPTPQQQEGALGRNDKNSNRGALLCNQCNAALPDFDSFRSHLKSHITQESTTAVCPHCGVTLRDSTEQERHIMSHFLITISEFACSYTNCKKTFTKPEELQKHLFDTHIQVMYKCSICSDIFDTKVAVQVHFACAHSNEKKLLRCSACMESFGNEKDFSNHVRTRHSSSGSAIQCIFCRAVCSSELEMHFHLAAHARQFRCPACPETFHVEFLLDRHMQTQHAQKDAATNGVAVQPASNAATPTTETLPMNTYHGAFNKHPAAIANNNNNILEYNSLATNKSLMQFPGNKFYSPLQVDTNAAGNIAKHSALMYGLSQRYFEANKTLMDIYNYNQENKNAPAYFMNPGNFETNRNSNSMKTHQPTENKSSAERPTTNGGFSCGICERSDFRTENDVHSHRKIVHNLKTGVSLRCAYCSGNFKSRSELEHHMKTCHNSTGKHKCLICDEIFPSPAVLAEHKLQHSKVGQSGKCSHCSTALNDVAMFKSHLSEHNTEGQIPVQCICCRQTLHSDFEVGLHAKFHTKSAGNPENACALCLESIPATSESRVCEKCCRKHNLSSKFNVRNLDVNNASRTYIENRCNLCKMILPHAQRLQEHLVEHTFVGCEERGYSCYICSAVFTVPAGLLNHMMEHGLHTRPYDCNLCSEKYFFRAELDNHLIEHELLGRNLGVGVIENGSSESSANAQAIKSEKVIEAHEELDGAEKSQRQPTTVNLLAKDQVKIENVDGEETAEKSGTHDDEEEEYIEVENIPEGSGNAKTQNKDR